MDCMTADTSPKVASDFSPLVFEVMQSREAHELVIDSDTCKEPKDVARVLHRWFKHEDDSGMRFRFRLLDPTKPASPDQEFLLGKTVSPRDILMEMKRRALRAGTPEEIFRKSDERK
jgi:hypothetical protein